MLEAEEAADQRSPVVRDQVDAVDLEGVEQGHYVGHQLLAVVPRLRSVGPPSPPQIGDDHPVIPRERRNHPTPLPPVLRKPVQQQDGIALAVLGNVHPQTRQLDDAMLDPVQLWDAGELLFHACKVSENTF